MRPLVRLAAAALTAIPLLVQPLFSGAAEAATLRWGAQRDIGSLDPDSFGDTFTLAFLNHIYEGLVRYDATLKVEPALATSWERVSPAVWRFHLRAGVKFHDGATLTADDVVASLKRATDDTSPLKGNLSSFKSARAIDPLTVDVELTGPYPLLLNDLTNIFIFSKPWLVANRTEMATDVGKGIEGYATGHTNGTGPFILESRQPDAPHACAPRRGERTATHHRAHSAGTHRRRRPRGRGPQSRCRGHVHRYQSRRGPLISGRVARGRADARAYPRGGACRCRGNVDCPSGGRGCDR